MIITPLFILFLIITFILVWFFIKSIDDRKWIVFMVSLVLTPIVYFYIFYPLINIFSSYHHQKYFEESSWKTKPAFRYEMSNYIVEEKVFIGKTKEEVEDQLGKSEWYGWDDTLKANSEQIWNYNLGFKPGAFNKNQECLQLTFKENKVVDAKQYQLEKKYE